MAIKHLDSVIIEDNQKIEIPENSTHYRCKSGKINFFKVNPTPFPSMKEIPDCAKYICFPIFRKHRGNINYGEIIFSDKNNNIF